MKEIKVRTRGVWYGTMAWWDEVQDAARYIVRLYISKTEVIKTNSNSTKEKETYQELACVEKDRNFKYHTFEGLGLIDKTYDAVYGGWYNTNKAYCVSVEAEDRAGEIIAKSQPTVAQIIWKSK